MSPEFLFTPKNQNNVTTEYLQTFVVSSHHTTITYDASQQRSSLNQTDTSVLFSFIIFVADGSRNQHQVPFHIM